VLPELGRGHVPAVTLDAPTFRLGEIRQRGRPHRRQPHQRSGLWWHRGQLRLGGIRGSLDAHLNVGRADIGAAFTRGQSRIDANLGKLHISLHPDSNVRVQVTAATSIRVSEDLVKTGRGTWTYGNGEASLEISGNISRVAVDVDVDVDVKLNAVVGIEHTGVSAP